MTPTDRIRQAYETLTGVRTRAGKRTPKLDALIAILNADLHDRAVGLTADTDITPAVAISHKYA